VKKFVFIVLGCLSAALGIAIAVKFVRLGFQIEGLTLVESLNQSVWSLFFILLAIYCFTRRRGILIGTALILGFLLSTPSCSHVTLNEHNKDEMRKYREDPSYKPRMQQHAHYLWEVLTHVH